MSSTLGEASPTQRSLGVMQHELLKTTRQESKDGKDFSITNLVLLSRELLAARLQIFVLDVVFLLMLCKSKTRQHKKAVS